VHAADAPPRFRVLGDQGAFVSHGLDQQEPQLRDGRRPGADPDFGVRDAAAVGGAAFHDGSGTAQPIELERGRWVDFYPGVVAAIRAGAAPPVAAEESVGVLELLEAARESAAHGTVVAVA
jgi:predicted dehydrogenase